MANTAIGSKGSNGKLECGRIFTKVVNVLAFDLNKRGTEKVGYRNTLLPMICLCIIEIISEIFMPKNRNRYRERTISLNSISL